jgi:hypothetical protein
MNQNSPVVARVRKTVYLSSGKLVYKTELVPLKKKSGKETLKWLHEDIDCAGPGTAIPFHPERFTDGDVVEIRAVVSPDYYNGGNDWEWSVEKLGVER